MVGNTGFSAGCQTTKPGYGGHRNALLRRTIVQPGVFMVPAQNLSKIKKGIKRCLFLCFVIMVGGTRFELVTSGM